MTGFSQGSVIIRNDGKYPEGALVVDGQSEEAGLLVHPLGGGMQLAIPASEVCRFQRVEESETVPVFSPGIFCIEGMEGEFAGWSDGSSWNGWEQPCFSREVAEQILQSCGGRWNYDGTADEFVVVTGGDEEPKRFGSQTVLLGDGGSVTVYFIGAGAWIWDKVP